MNKIKLIIPILLEKLRRYVFDNIYLYSRDDFKLKDNIIIWYYRQCIKICPKFRQILRNTGEEKYKRYSLPQL